MLELPHDRAGAIQRLAAFRAAADVRLERRGLESDLAVEELVDLVWKEVSFHG